MVGATEERKQGYLYTPKVYTEKLMEMWEVIHSESLGARLEEKHGLREKILDVCKAISDLDLAIYMHPDFFFPLETIAFISSRGPHSVDLTEEEHLYDVFKVFDEYSGPYFKRTRENLEKLLDGYEVKEDEVKQIVDQAYSQGLTSTYSLDPLPFVIKADRAQLCAFLDEKIVEIIRRNLLGGESNLE